MRVLAAMMILLVSGVQSSALTAVEKTEADVATNASDPCSDDDCSCEGDCSPVCDKCACALGMRLLPPPATMTHAAVVVQNVERVVAVTATAPPSPDLAGVFHPPRA